MNPLNQVPQHFNFYSTNDYKDILNELLSDNPNVHGEVGKLKKGNTGWHKDGSFEEQQKSRLKLNLLVLQFLQDGEKAGLLTNPEIVTRIRKFKARLARHRTFQNNIWLRKALELCTAPYIQEGAIKVPLATQNKLGDFQKQFSKHCEENHLIGGRQTFWRFHNCCSIPIIKAPNLIKKIQAFILMCLAEATMVYPLRGFALKCARKAASLWTCNAGIRRTLSRAYSINLNTEGAVDQLAQAAMLNPKKVVLVQEFSKQVNKTNPEDAITYFQEAILQDPTNLLAIQCLNESLQAIENHNMKKAIDHFALGRDKDALEIVLQQAEKTFEITNDDRDKFVFNWFKNQILCHEPKNKLFLAESELNKIFKHDGRLKKNFAFMHADAQINKEPLLEAITGGSLQNFTGYYFLYFLKRNIESFNIGNFTAKFQSSLQAWENLKIGYMDTREGEEQLNSFKKIWNASLEKIHDLLELEFKQSSIKQQNFFKEYINFNVKGITSLAEGEFHFIIANWFYKAKNLGHAVTFQITKQSNGSYSLTLVNTGDGLSPYHHAFVGRKIKYHPYYIIKDIPVSSFHETSAFYQKLIKIDLGIHKISSVAQIYEDLLETLHGIREENPIIHSPAGIITPQRSGSCSWTTFLALLKIHMQPLAYKEFIFKMKAQSILQFHNLVKENLDWDVEARKLLEIAMNEYQVRLEKMAKLQGNKGIKHLLDEKEWQDLEVLKLNL